MSCSGLELVCRPRPPPPPPSTRRRARLPANLVQAQRDFFGSHTFERTDQPAGQWFHVVWDESFGSADSITTSGYVA